MQFDEKVKNLFALCNSSKPQYKRGRGNKSTHSRLETSFINKENQQLNEQIKRRNSEYILIDEFTRHNEIKLRPVFYHLYLRSHKGIKHNVNDLTVKYAFFYAKVIKQSELLQQLYESKKSFIEVINHFHKDKQYQSSLSSGELVVDNNNNSKELNAYINELMDMEFIFYEFVEMVFFICRKYVLRKHLKDEQESYLDLINHLWMIVKIDWINKEECERGKYGYVYPKLYAHNKIERLEEEQKMKEEIEHRTKVLRPQLLAEVKRTREYGDLSENYEYKAAKQEKNKNESRIRYLQQMIDTAIVVEKSGGADTVGLFDRVTVYIPEDEEEQVFKIVTTVRVNALAGIISKESPIGSALMGRHVGDTVTIRVNDSYSYDMEIRAIEKGEDDGEIPINRY
jgi:transcription elongation factor GreA